jgi:hypothetical protein
MHPAAIILLAIIMLRLGVAIAKDGQEGPKFSFGATFINTVIVLSLLYWGGFFNRPA